MQQPWLAEAWREFGISERPGAADDPRVIALFRDAGHAGITDDEVAWCAAFVGACLKRAGFEPTGSLLARSYLDWGHAIDGGRPGALVVLTRGADTGAGHVGFWLGETAAAIYVLGGNQSDAVSVAAFDRERLLGYRWPEPVPHEATAAETEPDIFDAALAHVLEMEGGFTDDPHDPGGPTNRGITLGVYAAWKAITLDATNRAETIAALRRISAEEVAAIYRKRYFEPCLAARLPPALGLMHFDAAVNHGVGGAARLLQQALGVAIDGEIGPETLGAAHTQPTESALAAYAEVRRQRYRSLPHFWRFGRGWLRRVDRTLDRARSQFTHDQRGSPPMTNSIPAPTDHLPKWWGQSMTIWGALITAAATVLPALGPLIGADLTGEMVRLAGGQIVQSLQALVGLAGTIITIIGRVRATRPLERREVSVRL